MRVASPINLPPLPDSMSRIEWAMPQVPVGSSRCSGDMIRRPPPSLVDVVDHYRKGPRRGPRKRTRGGTDALHGLGPHSQSTGDRMRVASASTNSVINALDALQ